MIVEWDNCKVCESYFHWWWLKQEGGWVKEVTCLYPGKYRLSPDLEDNLWNRSALEATWHERKYIVCRRNADNVLCITDCPKIA